MTNHGNIGNEDPMKALCQMAAQTGFDDFPEDVIEYAKLLILDTFGVMIGGSGREAVKTIIDFTLEQGGKEESIIPVIGIRKVPASMAAFAMGVMARALDMGTVHEEAIHTAEHTLPPILAATCLQPKVSGRNFLTAFIIGEEFLVRIGIASRIVKSGVTHLTDGGHYIFGSVAAVAKVLGMNQEQLVNAEGMASTMTQPHSNAMYYPPTLMSRVHHGFIAQDAVNCCLLAQRGITGPTEQVLTGPCGYLNFLLPWQTDPDAITRDLAKKWKMTETSIKPYGACRRAHAAITGLLAQMHKHCFHFRDIESIHIDLHHGDFSVVATPYREKWNPQTEPACQFSLPYIIATAAYDEKVSPEAFRSAAMARDPVRNFMKSITAGEDNDLPPWSARVKTVLNNGSQHVGEYIHAKGHPRNPLTVEELIEKFKSCVALSVRKLDNIRVDTIIERILNLKQVEDVAGDLILPITPGIE